jgi:ribonuclease P/MRP protein subunit POP3
MERAAAAQAHTPQPSATAAPQERAAGTAAQEQQAALCVRFGLNAVTRHLEARLRLRLASRSVAAAAADPTFSTAAAPSAPPSPSSDAGAQYLFVTRADVDPPALLAHVPLLVQTYNASLSSASSHAAAAAGAAGAAEAALHLLALPAGAEALLGAALGVRRCSAVLLTAARVPAPAQAAWRTLEALVVAAGVQPPRAQWLEEAARRSIAANADGAPSARKANDEDKRRPLTLPPRVKMLRASAPTDLMARKRERGEQRAQKKRRRMEESGARGTKMGTQ